MHAALRLAQLQHDGDAYGRGERAEQLAGLFEDLAWGQRAGRRERSMWWLVMRGTEHGVHHGGLPQPESRPGLSGDPMFESGGKPGPSIEGSSRLRIWWEGCGRGGHGAAMAIRLDGSAHRWPLYLLCSLCPSTVMPYRGAEAPASPRYTGISCCPAWRSLSVRNRPRVHHYSSNYAF
ncbi:Uncharacterised protein [Mycobacteroides abscessus subsp. abscessus]|nr:Uncharacterised protein [Mycobacteroides abscessus subsp. abscessus]